MCEARLSLKDKKMTSGYDAIIKEYVRDGIVERVTYTEIAMV